MERTLTNIINYISAHSVSWRSLAFVTKCGVVLFLLLLVSCARMGSPDGGWYDETPPRVVGADPADKATDVHAKRVNIYFDEFVKIDNPNENVVVSPPQLQAPEIKSMGKHISVRLLDSLKANTTYTIDFSNAISDNNEGNPLGNYTYSFSTGDHIDTLEVSGYVIDAKNLEPVKGMLVGLYDNFADSVFRKHPMLRVSRTDSRGHFVIKGVAPGKYRIYALQDADGDYVFGQPSEMIAFSHDTIVPSFKPDIRQDTVWHDSLHISNILRVPYTHFLPDNICLRAFHELNTNRYLIKSERKEPNRFTLYYSYGDSILPAIKGLNFDAQHAFVIDASLHKDTITYWLKDTALVHQDTLSMVVSHHITDSLGVLTMQQDTLSMIAKVPYAKRLKDHQKKYEAWLKTQQKEKKKGEKIDSVMPEDPLKLTVTPSGTLNPDQNVYIQSQEPLLKVDTAHIFLYAQPQGDTLWYSEPHIIEKINALKYELKAAWKPGYSYSLEADSAAFENIYGSVSAKLKEGLKVQPNDEYGTLLVTLEGMKGKHIIGQLLDGSDQVVKQAYTDNGQLEFFYLNDGKYYLRVIVDSNNNHRWDTGNLAADKEPEMVYYYPEEIDCKAKWDITRSWNPTALPLYRQKPSAITQQKADTKKSVQHRNLERAKQLGIQYIPKIM